MNKMRKEKVLRASTTLDSEEEGAGDEFAALAYEVEAKTNLVRGQFLMYLFMLLTFTCLITSSSAAFQYFKCHEFPEADGGKRRFLYKDYSLDCDSTRYKRYVPYAITMIVIFPIGIPLFYWVVLWQHRHVLSDEEAVKREASKDFPTIGHLTFLTEAYSSKYYYFEVLECARRLMLASVVGILPEDGVVSPTLGILFCLAFLYIFTDFRPYRSSADSTHGIVMQYSITLLFLAGLLAKVNVAADLTPSEEAIFGYVLMVILALGPFLISADLLESLFPVAYYLKSLLFKSEDQQLTLKEKLQKQKEVGRLYRKESMREAPEKEINIICDDATNQKLLADSGGGMKVGSNVEISKAENNEADADTDNPLPSKVSTKIQARLKRRKLAARSRNREVVSELSVSAEKGDILAGQVETKHDDVTPVKFLKSCTALEINIDPEEGPFSASPRDAAALESIVGQQEAVRHTATSENVGGSQRSRNGNEDDLDMAHDAIEDFDTFRQPAAQSSTLASTESHDATML